MAEASIDQIFQTAVEHHQAGRLAQAEALYRQILARQPNHPDALHLLGVLAGQVNRNDLAVQLLGRAIAINPGVAEYHSNLCFALQKLERWEESAACGRRAVALKPDLADAQNNLGLALQELGRLDEAIACHQKAAAIKPDFAEAHNNLANAWKDKGQLDQAIACYQRALAIKPEYAEAHSNLGNAWKDKGQLDQAIACYRKALALKPDFADAHSNLGVVLNEKGCLDEAMTCCRRAVSLRPDFAQAHYNLANVLNAKGQLVEAMACYQRTLTLKPDFPEVLNNLGNLFQSAGRLPEAMDYYQRALAVKPDYAEACSNLGNTLKDAGQLDESMVCYRKALTLKPDCVVAHSNLIFSMQFHPGYDAAALLGEAQQWNLQHARPLKQFIPRHDNDPAPDRRLRVGYVSPDLRDHPAGRFLLPLLASHDHTRFEVFAYAQVPAPDAMTQRLAAHVDFWRSTMGLSDEQAAQQIVQDRIDILVDLAMHTADNRLLVFARKPAPVQVTWLAYPGGTGLETMDYRLTDPQLDPPGLNDGYYCEQSIRLPDTFWCYQPRDNTPEVNALPALSAGNITFGCLNNFAKVNAAMLSTWCQLLRQVPNSRLLLHCKEGSHRQNVRDLLTREGIDITRLEFAGKVPESQYFPLYHRIDIALDTFPHGGGTTTCDALWMGVPVISLAGQTAVSRAGLTILTNAGLAELVAGNPEQYVTIAADLASDLPRLAKLRSELRPRMQTSPLMDAPRFARNIEAAYRDMWRRWCDTQAR